MTHSFTQFWQMFTCMFTRPAKMFHLASFACGHFLQKYQAFSNKGTDMNNALGNWRCSLDIWSLKRNWGHEDWADWRKSAYSFQRTLNIYPSSPKFAWYPLICCIICFLKHKLNIILKHKLNIILVFVKQIIFYLENHWYHP